MSNLQNAVTAAFMMEGLTSFRFPELQASWHSASEQGAVQLVEQVMQYVPAITAMRAAAVAAGDTAEDTTGAFQDDVSVPFGQWMSCEIIANGGALPDRKHVIGYIASLMCSSCSFVAEEAINAKADDLINAVQ